jgi:3',5'-cyclic AMP phosphodiesterase CpdA
MRRLLAALCLLHLVLGCSGAGPEAPSRAGSPRTFTLLELSDIHYTTVHGYFVPAAWQTAATEGAASDPDVVVLGGDIVDDQVSGDQDLFVSFLDGFLPQLAALVRGMGGPVPLTLGNEDFFIDYDTSPEVMTLSLERYRQHLGDLFYLDDLANGVYPQPIQGMTWITLNSLVFSPKNRFSGRAQQASATLEWLQQQLDRLPALAPVVILTHIPPTMDLYDQTNAWDCQHLQRFVEILAGHPGPVVVLGAHFHRNEVHVLEVPGHLAVPVLLAGSTSFKYGNYPNWRSYVWTVDSEGALLDVDYTLNYPQHPEWTSRWSFQRPLDLSTYRAFRQELSRDSSAYLRYGLDLYARNERASECLDSPVIREALLDEVMAPPSPCPQGPGLPCPD